MVLDLECLGNQAALDAGFVRENIWDGFFPVVNVTRPAYPECHTGGLGALLCRGISDGAGLPGLDRQVQVLQRGNESLRHCLQSEAQHVPFRVV